MQQITIIRRNLRRDEDGELEKLCPCCREWWPLSEQFYGYLNTRYHYRSNCRACEANKESWRKFKRKVMASLYARAG